MFFDKPIDFSKSTCSLTRQPADCIICRQRGPLMGVCRYDDAMVGSICDENQFSRTWPQIPASINLFESQMPRVFELQKIERVFDIRIIRP